MVWQDVSKWWGRNHENNELISLNTMEKQWVEIHHGRQKKNNNNAKYFL